MVVVCGNADGSLLGDARQPQTKMEAVMNNNGHSDLPSTEESSNWRKSKWNNFVTSLSVAATIFGVVMLLANPFVPRPTPVTVAEKKMEEKLLASKIGDIIVFQNGLLCVMGTDRPYAVHDGVAHFRCSDAPGIDRATYISVMQGAVINVIDPTHPTYGEHASCFLQRKQIIIDMPLSANWRCG